MVLVLAIHGWDMVTVAIVRADTTTHEPQATIPPQPANSASLGGETTNTNRVVVVHGVKTILGGGLVNGAILPTTLTTTNPNTTISGCKMVSVKDVEKLFDGG